jgi:hypothetical protein
MPTGPSRPMGGVRRSACAEMRLFVTRLSARRSESFETGSIAVYKTTRGTCRAPSLSVPRRGQRPRQRSPVGWDAPRSICFPLRECILARLKSSAKLFADETTTGARSRPRPQEDRGSSGLCARRLAVAGAPIRRRSPMSTRPIARSRSRSRISPASPASSRSTAMPAIALSRRRPASAARPAGPTSGGASLSRRGLAAADRDRGAPAHRSAVRRRREIRADTRRAVRQSPPGRCSPISTHWPISKDRRRSDLSECRSRSGPLFEGRFAVPGRYRSTA